LTFKFVVNITFAPTQNFQWEELRKLYGESFIKELDRDGLSVFPTHNDEWLHNKSKILELNDENPFAKIEAKNQGVHFKGLPQPNLKRICVLLQP
jgi:hypothetical protein